MRKLLAVLLALTLMLSLVACSNNAEPEVSEPEVTEPEVTEPEVTEPEVTEPEVTEPEVTEPEVTEPEVTEPEPAPEPKPVYVADLFTAVPVTSENFGRGQVANNLIESSDAALTWAEGNGVTIVDATLVSFMLPEGVTMGNSIVVHIKGESAANFRTWLIDNNEVTSSQQVNLETDFGYMGGEFDEIIEYTVQYVDNDIEEDTATQFAFKAPSWNSTLENLTVTEVGVFVGTLDEYKAAVEAAGVTDAENADNAELAEGEENTDNAEAPAESDGE